MTSNSSLYGSTPQGGNISSTNLTTLYSGNNAPVANGNLVVPGTLTVNGCAILTNCNAFSLLPTNAESILFGGASTSMSIGSGSGVTTINNQLATANYTFPVNDGVSGQVLVTDGSGTVSFAASSTVGKTYSINASSTTGGANFNLVSSDPTTDTIKFANGSGISIVRTDADTITITNTDPGSAGVTSITGTANQVIASSSTGAVTLSLPQSIATTSSVAFGGLNVDSGTLYVDSTNNRVGINNTSPQYELHIDQGADGFTQFGMTTAERTMILTMNDGDNLLSLNYGSADRLQFDTVNQWFVSGNTGINTPTPAFDLDVAGDGRFTQSLITDGALKINGATSGYSNFTAPATGSTLNYTLPGAAGAANTVLTNNGSGVLSWALPGGGGSTFGNITIAVATDNTISTTTGDLLLDSASGTIELDGIVNIKGDYLNLNSDNSAVDSAMRFNGSAEINYNYAANQFEITRNLVVDGTIELNNTLKINGSTSGYTSFAVPATGSNLTYQLPGSAGAANTVLTNDGSGNLSWALPGGGGSTFGNITIAVATDNTISTTTGDLVLASATNLLDAGTLGADFEYVSVDSQATLDSNTLTTTSTSTVTLMLTTRNAMTGLINIIQGTDVHCVNFTALRVDATTALLTTFAEMYNTTALANFTADVSGGNLRLRITPTSATSTVFSVVRTSLT